MHRPFRVHALRGHNRGRLRNQHRIVEHQPLRFEQRPEIAAGQPRLNAIELIGRLAARAVEPRQLLSNARRRDRKP